MNRKEQWYLRDFDFLPESTVNRKDLSYTFFEEADKGKFKLFDKEYEAFEACIRVRELLHMENPDWLFDRFKESVVKGKFKK